jgi:hypothetical protein
MRHGGSAGRDPIRAAREERPLTERRSEPDPGGRDSRDPSPRDGRIHGVIRALQTPRKVAPPGGMHYKPLTPCAAARARSPRQRRGARRARRRLAGGAAGGAALRRRAAEQRPCLPQRRAAQPQSEHRESPRGGIRGRRCAPSFAVEYVAMEAGAAGNGQRQRARLQSGAIPTPIFATRTNRFGACTRAGRTSSSARLGTPSRRRRRMSL